MVEKVSSGDKVMMVTVYILLGLVALLCLYPMVHVLMGSFSDPVRLMRHTGVILWPKGFSLKGYEVVLNNPNIWRGYRNTLFYVAAGTAINILMTTFGAYALSRSRYMFKKAITVGIVFTMYFSGGMIPNFLLVQAVGIYNTSLAMLLPGAITTWNLIVMKTSFQSIPQSLEESAKIDGANDFVVLFRIFMPVAKATIAVMVLFYAVGHWNAWFNAMLYLQDRGKYPLQLFLREILIASSTGGNMALDTEMPFMEDLVKYATIIVSTLPILCVYPFAQKYFMTGVMLGSLKE
ncbi:MAG: carbohydrate ABC transporter permease [Candidatus Limiplasma sp.]|nr:carbohydrate ABC transporter permease [Candidatus Limiplasma sp.]